MAPWIRLDRRPAELSPREQLQKLTEDATKLVLHEGPLLRELPGEVREILRQIKAGKAKLDVEHQGLDYMLRTYDRISNRLAFAIVLASLVIGSSLIMDAHIPPLWNEVPLLGVVGFVGAGVLGFWLLISIMRHGRM